MNAAALTALAGVIRRAEELGRTPTEIAFAVESAGMHMSPETAAELETLRKRVAELEAERHSTNEALSDAAERMRADRDRIAELEAGIAWRDAERSRWADVHALVERAIDKGWSTVDTVDLEVELGPEPTAPSEAPCEGPQRHEYRVCRDLPEMGGAS